MANEMGWTQKNLKKVVVEKRGKKGPRQKVRLSTQYLNGRNRQDKSQDSSLAIYHRGNSHKRSRATKKEKKEEENAAAWRNVKSHEWYPIQNLGQLNWMDRWTFVGLLCGKQQEKSSRWIRQRRNDLSSLNKKTRMKHSNVLTWNEISKLIFSAVLRLA